MRTMATVPTKDEILQLPRWARVAFAARCARRVQPLFLAAWPQVPQKYAEAIVRAIDFAEQSAADAAKAAYADADADADAYAARADAAAARADAAAAAYAARAAARAAAYADKNMAAIVRNTIRFDFDTLLQFSQNSKWDDSTPVPPTVFGPMWPEGCPDGWPADSAPLPSRNIDEPSEFKLVLRAMAEPGVTAEEVAQHLVKLFKAMNQYSLAKYGRRLTKDGFKRLVAEYTAVRV